MSTLEEELGVRLLLQRSSKGRDADASAEARPSSSTTETRAGDVERAALAVH
jgi:hypothetical protein